MLPNDLDKLTKGGATPRSGRKALGRGLGALIPGKSAAKARYFDCPIERINPAEGQPRRVFDQDAIAELAASIEENGIIQPLVVREEAGDYRLIAGERRLRAARLAEIPTVPVVIKDVSDDEAFELALIENIQRQDLNPLEEAEAYERLMEARDYTQEQLASRLGRSRSAIANTVRLLKLEPDVRPLVESGEVSEGAARALLSLPDPDDQIRLAEAALEHQLSVRNIEAVVKLVKDGAPLQRAVAVVLGSAGRKAAAPRRAAKDTPTPWADKAEVQRWTSHLTQRFGTDVKMNVRGKKGSIQLFFDDRDALEALLQDLIGQQDQP